LQELLLQRQDLVESRSSHTSAFQPISDSQLDCRRKAINLLSLAVKGESLGQGESKLDCIEIAHTRREYFQYISSGGGIAAVVLGCELSGDLGIDVLLLNLSFCTSSEACLALLLPAPYCSRRSTYHPHIELGRVDRKGEYKGLTQL